MAIFWFAMLAVEAVMTIAAVVKSAESEGGSDGGAS